MVMKKIQDHIESLFALADIRVNGDRAWDIQVHNASLFSKIVRGGSLAMGESYRDGWWDCDALDQFFHKVFSARLDEKVDPVFFATIIKLLFINMQNRARSLWVVKKHYDLPPQLYMSFLDPYNQYTCAYFKDTDDLNTAQERKLALICGKLMLGPDDSVLDVGCGWGGFAKFAAENYGCSVTGITLSGEQAAYAREFCRGLPVEIIQCDYRDFHGSFDKVLVCGMIEHVGYKNYAKLMNMVCASLKQNGLFLLQTIGKNISTKLGDPWIDRYIFPNGLIPSVRQITAAAEGLFRLEDWHFMGDHYDRTLMAWYENFVRNWDRIKSDYDDKVFRIWKYYFLSCAGSFRSRMNDLWQIVFSKNGLSAPYVCVR